MPVRAEVHHAQLASLHDLAIEDQIRLPLEHLDDQGVRLP